MMKVTLLKSQPTQIFTCQWADAACSVALACLPDGTIIGSRFLHKASKLELAEAQAEWEKKWPQSTITPAPKNFKPDTNRGALAGTEFQLKVWQRLAKQKPGTTTTYGTLAASIGHPAAVRAVGTAVGRNPLAPFIPCHLVLGKGGALGGFAGGLPLKVKLLTAEGIAV